VIANESNLIAFCRPCYHTASQRSTLAHDYVTDHVSQYVTSSDLCVWTVLMLSATLPAGSPARAGVLEATDAADGDLALRRVQAPGGSAPSKPSCRRGRRGMLAPCSVGRSRFSRAPGGASWQCSDSVHSWVTCHDHGHGAIVTTVSQRIGPVVPMAILGAIDPPVQIGRQKRT
jgi:hypothetical protein